MPAITGFFLAVGFGALADGDTTKTYWCAAAVALSELIRMVAIHYGALIWTAAWIHMQTLLRANLLAAQMASGGPEAGRPIALGRRGDHPLPRRHRGRRQLRRRHGRRVRRHRLHRVRRHRPRCRRRRAPPRSCCCRSSVSPSPPARSTTASRCTAPPTARPPAEVTGLVGDVMAAATTVKVNGAVEPLLARLKVLVDASSRDGGA